MGLAHVGGVCGDAPRARARPSQRGQGGRRRDGRAARVLVRRAAARRAAPRQQGARRDHQHARRVVHRRRPAAPPDQARRRRAQVVVAPGPPRRRARVRRARAAAAVLHGRHARDEAHRHRPRRAWRRLQHALLHRRACPHRPRAAARAARGGVQVAHLDPLRPGRLHGHAHAAGHSVHGAGRGPRLAGHPLPAALQDDAGLFQHARPREARRAAGLPGGAHVQRWAGAGMGWGWGRAAGGPGVLGWRG
jgi:hypothetical protein